jgi:hypothetical protein
MARTPRAASLLVLLALLPVAACGDESTQTTTASAADADAPSYLSLAEAEAAFEGARVELVRDREAIIAPEVHPAPRDSARFASNSGAEFGLLVFATAGDARRAVRSVQATDLVSRGGGYAVARNLIAVFPAERGAAHVTVARAMRRLAQQAGAPRPSLYEITQATQRYAGRIVTVDGTLNALVPRGSAHPRGLELVRAGDATILVVPAGDADVPEAILDTAAHDPHLRAVGRVGVVGSDVVTAAHTGDLGLRDGDAVIVADSIEPVA